MTEPSEGSWGDAPEDRPAVVGIDLSLTGTGIAYANGSTVTIATGALRGPERLVVIRDAVRAALDVAEWAPDLAVVEGYAYGRSNQAHQLGELGGVIRVALHEECLEFPSMGWALVPPPKLKKFATGKGVADKTAMVVAARERLGWMGMDNNQADALWLRAMGLALYGALPITLPQLNMSALSAVQFERRPKGLER